MGIISCTPATQREERLREVRQVNIPVVVAEGVGVEANEDDSKKSVGLFHYILSQSE
jgi:hypothetical protein